MAASLGVTSLGEVHHEGLDELLHDLANVYSASPGQELQPLGVPILDALLEVFMLRTTGPIEPRHQNVQPPAQPLPTGQNPAEDEEMLFHGDEQDRDLVASDEPPPVPGDAQSPSNVFFSDSANRAKRPSPVVEISSSLSAAGKSQLLYYLTARAVLPRSYGDIPIGGQEAAVVLIDADDRFSADWLRTVARGIIRQVQESLDQDTSSETAEGPSDDDIEAFLTSSLQHVHVFRPQSSSALLATLCTLDAYLYDTSRHYSASRPLQMLAIDSATAFFWQDRLRDERARTEDIGRPRAEIDQERAQQQSFYLSDLYAELVQELKRLQSRFGCTVVYTTTASGNRPPPSSSGGPYDRPPSRNPSLRPALPAPWGTFPVLRLVVHRDTVRSFPPAMSAHDALKDALMRHNVVHQGKFSAWVNAWGHEEWPRRVVGGIDALEGGCFSFCVRDDGVEIPLSGR